MSQAFVVEVTEKPKLTPPESLESLAKAFKIEPRKVELMLKRLPGVATKPISEQEASVVITYFEQAGLKANLKLVTPVAPLITPELKPGGKTEAEGADLKALGDIEAQQSADAAKDSVETASMEQVVEASEEMPAIEIDPLHDEPSHVPSDEISAITELLNINSANSVPGAALLEDKPGAKLEFPDKSFEHPSSFDSFQEKATFPDDHDLLRSTLIRDPDPRKTLSDAQDKATRRTLPDLDPGKTMSGIRRDVRKTLTDAEIPVPTPAVDVFSAPKRRGGLRRDLLLTAMLPACIALIGTLGVAYFRLQPVLQEGLWESARTPAIATAASISSVLTQTPDGQVDFTQLQKTIDSTRQAFDRQHVSFIAATDASGEVISAWFAGGGNSTADGSTLQNAIRDQALLAITQSSKSLIPVIQGQLEVVSQPLMLNNRPVGAIVVGVTNQGMQRDILSTIASVAMYSLIPLLLAVLLAVLFARPLTRKVLYLTDRADQISRGELSNSVEVKSNNELGDLGEALERMRVSMQEALERLRRRR